MYTLLNHRAIQGADRSFETILAPGITEVGESCFEY